MKYWKSIVTATAIFIALAMQGPFLIHILNPAYEGVYVHLNSDEEIYLARVQEALTGNWTQVAEAFVGEEGMVGSQFALIELVYGMTLSPVFDHSWVVLTVMDSVIPVLIFLVLIWFLSICGFTKLQSYTGSLILIVTQLYNLNRPIHLRSSFLLMMLALIALSIAYKKKRQSSAAIGGMLLGTLVGVYVWSWTFAWLWLGILLVWQIIEKKRVAGRWSLVTRQMTSDERRETSDLQILLLALAIGIIFALPFIFQIFTVTNHPLYDIAIFRSGMRPGRLPESWVYSALFLTMIVGLLILLKKKYKELEVHRPAVVIVFTAFGVMHQQAIHGTVFNFVSHSIFSLLLAAIIVILLAWKFKSKILIIPALAAILYISAVAYDGRWLIKQWNPSPGNFASQHLSDLLSTLDEIPRARILSDRNTLSLITSHTHHDVVYSIYLKNILLSHKENAQRVCLTYLPLDPNLRNLEASRNLVYADALGAFPDPKVREEELELVRNECAQVDKEPNKFLTQYGIDLVVWDEKSNPEWDLNRLKSELQIMERGEGWSAWRLKR
ncbi:MAG: hypothetical protein QF755_04515 [Candidatus Peribacteraceae bacterium]|nr:hypothetical protein [Candidatus Peribacteraceae bacterium]